MRADAVQGQLQLRDALLQPLLFAPLGEWCGRAFGYLSLACLLLGVLPDRARSAP
jgi:hypothetical protein